VVSFDHNKYINRIYIKRSETSFVLIHKKKKSEFFFSDIQSLVFRLYLTFGVKSIGNKLEVQSRDKSKFLVNSSVLY
jgi:hypothetical protein